MRTKRRLSSRSLGARGVSVAAVVVAFASLLPLASVARAERPSGATCVRAWGEARFNGVGFNHLVHLLNSCGQAAECVVTTDVNPEPVRVEVAAKSEEIVNTFLGSPARSFTPHAKCTLRD